MTEDISKALKTLNDGGVILYPTDTIWGIGCDATNEEAVSKVYKIKQRSDSKSMLVLIDDANRIPSFIEEVPEIAWDLIDASDSPLTIIYPGAKNLAKNLLGENNSVGIRITKDTFCKQLIYKFRKPIVSTSANISGLTSPSIFDEIDPSIIDAVDFVVGWRQDDVSRSKASAIIKLGLGGQIEILRK